MDRGLLIDTFGRVWPLLQPPDLGPTGQPDAAAVAGPGILYLVLGRAGAKVIFCGRSVSTPALYKALRILASWQPQRIALTQCESRDVQVTIFGGVWEFAGHAETLARGA
jgi:hypothetical protein